MSSLVVLGLLGTFGAVLAGAMVIGSRTADRRRALQLLEATVGTAATADLREQRLAPSLSARMVGSAVGTLGPVARRFAPNGARERITKKLVQAGNPAGWDADKFLLVRFSGAILLPLFAYLIFADMSTAIRLVATAFGAYVGLLGPSIMLDGRIERRQAAIRRALPDTTDLLTISVEAGLAFDAALRQVVENVPGELSEEIARTLREMQLGISRADAFRNLKERTEVEELRGFTLAIIQADAFGISIANVLRAQSETQRMKRKQRTEERAMKIPVKILFPVIFCVLPSLFIVVLGPGIIRFVNNFMGGG